MATITERKHPSGNVTYRVRLRKRGIPTFSLTFDSLEEASDWVRHNERLFYNDPTHYFLWRELLYYKMQRENLNVSGHILKPKSAITVLVETGSQPVEKTLF